MKKLLFGAQLVGFLTLAVNIAYAQTLNIIRPNVIPDTDIGKVIGAVVGLLLVISAIAAFLFLILGGLQWITSGGDKAGMEAARSKITSAIIGLIIVAAAWAIMLLLGQFIGFDIFNANQKLPTIVNPNP